MNDVLGAVFFGPGNTVETDPRFMGFDWRAARGEVGNRTVVLPRVDASGGLHWYVLAPDDVLFDEARETVTAFLGHSYSDFRGQPARPASGDAIDVAVNATTDGRWFRVPVADRDIVPSIQAMCLLQGLLSERPPRGRSLPRPIGRLLRDIDMALGVGRHEEASRIVDQVEVRGVLDRRNLAFLRIRVACERRRFDQVFELPDLAEVIAGRRPAAVTESLLVAVYGHYLAGFERRDAPAEQLAFFRATVHPDYEPLLGTRGSAERPAALKVFAMGLIVEQAEDGTLDDVLAMLPGPDRAWIERVRTEARPEPPPAVADPLEEAEALVRNRRYDRAVALVEPMDPSPAVFRILLDCVPEVHTQAAADAVFRVRRELTDTEFEGVVGEWRTRAAWEHVVEHFGAVPGPRDWTSWLQQVEAGAVSAAVAVEQGGRWPLGSGGDIAELLQGAWLEHPAEVNRALPQLLAAVRTQGVAGRRLRTLCAAIVEIIEADDLSLISDLDAVLELAELRLEAGLSEEDYADQVNLIARIWKSHEAPRYLEWALDAVEMLALYPSPRPAERRMLFGTVVTSAVRFAHRLDRATRQILALLCRDLGADGEQARLDAAWDEAPEDDEDVVDLGGRHIAIYTLTERVGRNAKELLLGTYPGVRVELSHDTGGSPRLKQLARNADLFVVCTRSAKHAATEYIADERSGAPTVFPDGKGASSILRAVSEIAQTL